ncbi:MAG: peptide-methionine (S)-S-oxide reductase MsrA [Candidatus Puniceispirillum sp.]|jgi:peptide-methionine (S)-S-oxide reductase|nr:peptide-methionine (S)-S-oxide reductase MsrA [Candidatus Puniceispirillum sp.]MBL6674011.1 peptide-methionine (S)-S-oxide reductase MsrA [Candidatus Puniceispirillum sp.]
MFFDNPFKTRMPRDDEYLAGRHLPIFAGGDHAVLGTDMSPPFAETMQQIIFGLGCFWGAERLFWTLPGVHVTAVGYAGGRTPHPTYEEVCSGQTGHTEVVLVVFDPQRQSLGNLLQTFWQAHDPTQGFRQGNDRGTQYRSAIFATDDAQLDQVTESANAFQKALTAAGFGKITTEIALAGDFYYAETYHQQYLHKVPNGYCGLRGTGVACLSPAGDD